MDRVPIRGHRAWPGALCRAAASGRGRRHRFGWGGQRVLLAGHSLGGTLAAIFAALHPDRVRGLVLLEAPAKFGRAAGAFAPLVAVAPCAGALRAILGDVPGSFLDIASIAASPASFVW